MADTAAPATPPSGTVDKSKRPTKPDEAAFKIAKDKAEREWKEAQDKLNAVRAKLDLAQPPKGTQSPAQQRQAALRKELNDIRNSQSSKKGARGAILDQVKNLDTQLKSKQAELKANKSRTNFKNVQELDAEVRRLQSDVDSGNMKIVDEKKALAQISTLRKQRKNFDQFEEDAKYIDSIKEKIADLKKQLDDPESKALSDRYNEITAELDKIKAEQDEAYKNLSTLRDERTALQNLQQEKWKAMKQIQDDHYAAKKAYREWENEFYKAKKERQRAEREKQEREERRKRAEEMLAEASIPAFQDEILTCENLIGYFDPNSPEAAASKTKAPLLAHSESLRAQAQRTVDASGIKGVKLVKKDEREDDYFMAATTTKKKGKKGGKKDVVVTSPDAEQPATPTSGKFQLSIGIIEELRKVNVEAPASQAEVANVLEKLRAKLAEYKANQKTTTEENIAKAKKEIEKLDAEAEAAATAAAEGEKTANAEA